MSREDNSRYALIAGAITISIAIALMVLKAIAWVQSDSAAVLASLVDSVMDVGVSAMNLLVIRFSLKPADEDHRYGHGKAEGIAALFQSAFITGVAIFLLLEAFSRFFNPGPVSSIDFSIGVMLVSMIMSVVIVTVQRFCMKKAPSLAVEADSAHYSSDVLVNAGAIATLLALRAGAPAIIDPVFAMLVFVYLVFTVRHIGQKAIDMLMDRELPPEVRQQIHGIILSHPQAYGVHDLRTRQIGMKWSISFDVEMDAKKSFQKIHEYARQIEKMIADAFPQAEVMIHMDPVGDRADSRHPHLAEP